jgi:integrase
VIATGERIYDGYPDVALDMIDSRTFDGRIQLHACRHWCASTLLAATAPITAVAGHLGDTVETLSRTYVHWLRDDRDMPAEVLDPVLAPPDARSARDEVAASDA